MISFSWPWLESWPKYCIGLRTHYEEKAKANCRRSWRGLKCGERKFLKGFLEKVSTDECQFRILVLDRGQIPNKYSYCSLEQKRVIFKIVCIRSTKCKRVLMRKPSFQIMIINVGLELKLTVGISNAKVWQFLVFQKKKKKILYQSHTLVR